MIRGVLVENLTAFRIVCPDTKVSVLAPVLKTRGNKRSSTRTRASNSQHARTSWRHCLGCMRNVTPSFYERPSFITGAFALGSKVATQCGDIVASLLRNSCALVAQKAVTKPLPSHRVWKIKRMIFWILLFGVCHLPTATYCLWPRMLPISCTTVKLYGDWCVTACNCYASVGLLLSTTILNCKSNRIIKKLCNNLVLLQGMRQLKVDYCTKVYSGCSGQKYVQ